MDKESQSGHLETREMFLDEPEVGFIFISFLFNSSAFSGHTTTVQFLLSVLNLLI